MRMKDRLGIVTAAASGMGRAGSLLLAREGASVCVVDVSREGAEAVVAEIKAGGGRAFAIAADLRTDGRLMRDIWLAQVKAPGVSKAAWDYLTLTDAIPATDAFRPTAKSACPLLKPL